MSTLPMFHLKYLFCLGKLLLNCPFLQHIAFKLLCRAVSIAFKLPCRVVILLLNYLLATTYKSAVKSLSLITFIILRAHHISIPYTYNLQDNEYDGSFRKSDIMSSIPTAHFLLITPANNPSNAYNQTLLQKYFRGIKKLHPTKKGNKKDIKTQVRHYKSDYI